LKLDSNTEHIDELVRRAAGGEEAALVELFSGYRSRLWRMIRLRLDRRLQGRIDPSEVLQDAFIDVAEKLPEYALRSALPFSLWLRMVVGERLQRIHRHHLGASMRDVGREVSAGELDELRSALLLVEDVKPQLDPMTASGSLEFPGGGPDLERLGDFRILRELGRGGIGIVYKAEQEPIPPGDSDARRPRVRGAAEAPMRWHLSRQPPIPRPRSEELFKSRHREQSIRLACPATTKRFCWAEYDR
jgi:hypothetical protein